MQGKRIGVLRSYVDVPFNDPEIVRLFNQAVADLEAGGRVEELSYMSGRNLLKQVHGGTSTFWQTLRLQPCSIASSSCKEWLAGTSGT